MTGTKQTEAVSARHADHSPVALLDIETSFNWMETYRSFFVVDGFQAGRVSQRREGSGSYSHEKHVAKSHTVSWVCRQRELLIDRSAWNVIDFWPNE